MSPSPAIGPSRRHLDPPTIQPLVRKRRAFLTSLDVLANEIPILERRRDDAAASALNGGGAKASRQYDRLVEELTRKASERTRLQHAIAALDRQITEECQRLEDEKRANALAFAKRLRASEIKRQMTIIREQLDGIPIEERIGLNGEVIISGRARENDPRQRAAWERQLAILQKELDDGMPNVTVPGDVTTTHIRRGGFK